MSAINGDSNAVVNASQSGLSTVAMAAKQTGVTYPFSSSCTYDTTDFSHASFTTSDTGANSGTQLAFPVYWFSLNQAPDGRITGASDQVNVLFHSTNLPIATGGLDGSCVGTNIVDSRVHRERNAICM